MPSQIVMAYFIIYFYCKNKNIFNIFDLKTGKKTGHFEHVPFIGY